MDAQKLRSDVEALAVEWLGNEVKQVVVDLLDHDTAIGIAAISPEGWRHAVRSNLPIDDPKEWTARACDVLLSHFDGGRRYEGDVRAQCNVA
jgi:hypothetical protein